MDKLPVPRAAASALYRATVAKPVTPSDASVTPRYSTVTPSDKPADPVTARDALTMERWALLDRLDAIEAEIGPQTPAERQRRRRKKT